MKDYSSMFMDIAERTAKESNCVKYRIGAVIVKDDRIILQGYNGTISGCTNCSDKFYKNFFPSLESSRKKHREWSNINEIHSEMNIICYAAKKGISLENTTLYCTYGPPCNNCLKHLIQAGIKKIIYKNEYPGKTGEGDREELLRFIEIIKL
jgi:dCMP deaminase